MSLAFVLAAAIAASAPAAAQAVPPRVALDTSKGRIVVELDPERAPGTVENFLQYVRDGFYDGTVFHRVISGFMIQGGGFTPDLTKKSTRASIQNEADNGLSNTRGTIAMARTGAPHSATAQFYINHADNSSSLDHKGGGSWGYAVFGRVVEGMETVDAIAGVATTTKSGMRDVPMETVLIEHASILGE